MKYSSWQPGDRRHADRRMIGRRRDGRSVFYRLSAREVKPLAKLLYRLFCKSAETTPGRRAEKKEDPNEQAEIVHRDAGTPSRWQGC